MAYEIEVRDGYLEVRISGEPSRYEILQAVGELAERDPGKDLPDLWILDCVTMVPYAEFAKITETIKQHLPAKVRGKKTAFVTDDGLQQAELELYISEAAILGLDIRIFDSLDLAVVWITDS